MKRGNLMKKISNEIQILAETLTLPKVVIEQMIVQAKNILDEVFEQYSHELMDPNKAKATAKKIDKVYEEEPFAALAICSFSKLEKNLSTIEDSKNYLFGNNECFY